MHRLPEPIFPNRKQIVHDDSAPRRTALLPQNESTESTILHWKLPSGESSRMLIFLMKYLPKVPDDAYVKVETTKILKQHKAYMAQFEKNAER